MTKNVLASIFASARELLRNARALALLVVLYLALIAACFFFITTREATLWQVFLTALTAAGAPLLFFIVQAACANFAVGARDPKELLRTTARSFVKLVAISLPLVLLAVLCFYLLDKLENRVKPTPEERARAESSMSAPDEEAEPTPAAPQSKPPVRWGYLFVSALRLFMLGVMLPLVAIHLWIAAARDNLKSALRQSPRHVARAFSARAVLTYGIGMIVFALIPYFLITKRTPVSSGSLEIGIFGLRILLAFMLMLFGWVMTMTALAHDDNEAAETPALRLDETQPHAAPATATTS